MDTDEDIKILARALGVPEDKLRNVLAEYRALRPEEREVNERSMGNC